MSHHPTKASASKRGTLKINNSLQTSNQFIGINPIGMAGLLSQQTASNVAEVTFTNFTSYQLHHTFYIYNVAPVNDGARLQVQYSYDGSTYLTGNYYCKYRSGVTAAGMQNTIIISSNAAFSNAAAAGSFVMATIVDPLGTDNYKILEITACCVTGSAVRMDRQMGVYTGGSSPKAPLAGIRFSFNSGLIKQGTFSLYGGLAPR
ncbi:MAG: hypothetical protein K0S07_784 [Chlamydiales bacterium]|jgi:hypothetical protein|nr:hypothetical protein [Chlamydiales bacterium]